VSPANQAPSESHHRRTLVQSKANIKRKTKRTTVGFLDQGFLLAHLTLCLCAAVAHPPPSLFSAPSALNLYSSLAFLNALISVHPRSSVVPLTFLIRSAIHPPREVIHNRVP
jgi:hypothetical protein